MSDPTGRRSFLKAGAAVAAGLAAWRLFSPFGAAAQGKKQQKIVKDVWIAVLGKIKDLDEKEPTLIKAQFKDAKGELVAEEKLFVRWIRMGKELNKWIVLSSICPHLKCKVDYDSDTEGFVCPCHGSTFNRYGALTKGPSKKDLHDYSEQVYEEDGYLKLKKPAE
jgi:Rieske Fe-S protein